MILTLGVNMTTRKITPFFLANLLALFHGVPLVLYVMVCKTHIYMPKMTFKPVNTDISSLRRIY